MIVRRIYHLCGAARGSRVMRLVKYLSLLLLSAMFAPVSAPAQSGGCTAFTGVTVVSTDVERLLPNQTVLVRGEHIDQVAASGYARFPKSCTIINGRNRFLIPG